MERGTVSRYFTDRGYGFFNDGHGGSLFFHVKNREFGGSEPAPGDSLFFDRDTDSQGRSYARRWVAARDVAGLDEINGCFVPSHELKRYPFLRSILERHSTPGRYSVTTKTLSLELAYLKSQSPSNNISSIGTLNEYVYVIARGQQPVALRKGLFLLDDIIQPGPLVQEELARLKLRDSDITAIVWIEINSIRCVITIYV